MPIDLEQRLRHAVAESSGSDGVPRFLNIGSGRDRRHGYVNVDLSPLPEVDVVASLTGEALPFPDDTFTVVLAGTSSSTSRSSPRCASSTGSSPRAGRS